MSIYGYKLTTRDPDALVQYWEQSLDPEDMLLPESEFVVCSTLDEAKAELIRRNPVVKSAFQRDVNIYRVEQSGYNLLVHKYPTLKADRYNFTPTIGEISSFCVTNGPLAIAGYYREGIRDYLSRLSGFHDSNLVISEDRLNFLTLFRYDAKKAQARRTRKVNAKKASEAAAKAREVKYKQDQADRKVEDTVTAVYTAAYNLIEVLWKTTPTLKLIWDEDSYYIRHHFYQSGRNTVTDLKAVLTIRAKFVPKADRTAWRQTAAARDLFEKVLSAYKLFGTKFEKAQYQDARKDPEDKKTYSFEPKDPVIHQTAFDWLMREAKAHRRRTPVPKAAHGKKKKKTAAVVG